MIKTKIINLISWPGVWKSTMAALLFVHMKIAWHNVEYVPEFAKQLIWKKEFDILNNQYYVSQEQYKLLKSMVWVVDYIITDGSLIHWIHYNRINPDNISNIEKTEKKILESYNEFENINIYLDRNNNIDYETAGRIQNLEEAKIADSELQKILNDNNIEHINIMSDINSIQQILDYITKNSN